MKLIDITKKNDAELTDFIKTSRDELAKAVLDYRTKEIKDVKQLGRLKKTVAQALTINRERQIAKEEATQ